MVAAVWFDYLAVVAVSDGLLEKDKNRIIKATVMWRDFVFLEASIKSHYCFQKRCRDNKVQPEMD